MNEAELKPIIRHIILAHNGRQNPITARELVALTGEPDRRVRLVIEELIDSGFPVCSVTEYPAGYFFPANLEEAKEYTRALRHRAGEIFRRRRFIIRNTARWYETARQEAML